MNPEVLVLCYVVWLNKCRTRESESDEREIERDVEMRRWRDGEMEIW